MNKTTKTTKSSNKKSQGSTSPNFFKQHKVSLIVGCTLMCLSIIGAIVAVNVINHNKEQAHLQAEAEQKASMIANFKKAYLLSTGEYTAEQETCIWSQIEAITTEDDIAAAAAEYQKNGQIASDSSFANKVYASAANIFKKCGIEGDATSSVDKITDVIDVTLTGHGTTSSDVVTLRRGLINITLTGTGSIGFDIKSTNVNQYISCFDSFGGAGSVTATYTKKCTIDYAGDYYFDIHNSDYKSSGYEWTMNIRQE